VENEEKSKTKRGREEMSICAVQTAHVASAKGRIRRRLKGIKMKYMKCRKRKIVTVRKGEGNRLFAQRTRSTSCAGCAVRKSSL